MSSSLSHRNRPRTCHFFAPLHDLTHLGVQTDTSPSDARYIILTNSISLIGVSLSLFYLIMNSWMGGTGALRPEPSLLSAAVYAVPPWLNYCRRYWAATTYLCVAAIATHLTFTVIFGPAAGNQFYFLPILGAVTLIYPPRHRRSAAFFVLIALAVFIAIVVWSDKIEPLMATGLGTAHTYYVMALSMSAALVAFITYYSHRRTVLVEAQLEARSHELVKTLGELQATQAQMIEAENQALLGRLVAGVLHEVNTPLGSIRSASATIHGALPRWEQIVQEHADRDSADGAAALRAIEVSSQLTELLQASTVRISTVVEGLRHFVGLDEAERKPLDVRDGIDGALALLGPSLEDRIDVIRDYAHTVPELLCFPAKLNRAFLSVLQNAAQAIDARGVIRVKVRELDGHIEIEIVDDGKGVPAAMKPEIFELGLTRKEGRVGLRLGLPMTRHSVEEIGGRLTLESVEGEGTTVRMTLPLSTG